MATKTLIIKTQNGVKVDSTDKWLVLNGADAVIDQIDTAQGSKSASIEQFNTLVSGVPSPWARVKLTDYALSDNSEKGDQRILIECYRHMRSEWRGLIAAYILYSDRFTLSKPIALAHKSIDNTYGQFDLRSVLGDMLFNESRLWQHSTEEPSPKIQLLYYRDRNYETKQLVGATSPYTLFFAASNYALQSSKNDIYWIDENGKFTDPTDPESYRERFADPQCQNNIKKIVSFLKSINANREKYRDEFIRMGGEDVREQMQSISHQIGAFIERWLRDIRMINSEWVDIDNSTMPVTINSAVVPAGPMAKLFETNYTYYWYDGAFLLSGQDNALRVEKVQDLFIDSKYLVGFKSAPADVEKFRNAPVTYMYAKDGNNGQEYFLTLPFSRFAIEECFKSEISQIILGNNDKVKVRTEIKAGVVKVVLQARFTTPDWVDILSKEFTIVEPDSIGHVFTWPNFASKIWNKYYFYSEYPTNGSGIRVLPVFERLDGSGKIDFEKVSPREMSEAMQEMFLVKYPVGKVDTSAHRYEILRTPCPVKLLAVKVDRDEKECPAGFLLIKTRTDAIPGSDAMRIIKTDIDGLSKASVGIDFGSTNTCAYYNSDKDGEVQAVPFANRRLALIGFDNDLGNLAQKHELYFISNETPINKNGQVKSWLHLHNSEYIEEAKSATELVGGVPVNETNITVKAMTENEITTNAGTLCCNMKWLSDRKGNDSKNSFMATIWLQICADLFDKGLYPEKLHWSYPSAMSRKDIGSLQKIYRQLNSPIEGLRPHKPKSHTESEAVCSYAISKKISLTNNRLFLGIDIGGSTSDILITGRNPQGNIQLYTQCSLRIAANHFFKAINASEKFRKALHRFHESKTTKVKVINIDDIINPSKEIYSRSPYYLNNIFDQLSNNEFDTFYNSLSQSVPFVFALPSYITGILVYYSGLLVRNAIKSKGIEGIESVNMRYYGKGGRTFEWLYRVYEDDARRYFAECFKAGFGAPIRYTCDNIEELYDDNTVENKSEVAIGLVNLKDNIAGVYNTEDEYSTDTLTPIEFQSEVFGEPGFTYTNAKGERVAIDELEIVSGDFYRNLYNPETFDNFYKFIDIYCNLLKDTGIINDSDLISTLKNKRSQVENVMQFFDNDNEYRKYQRELDNSDAPSYRMPIFIAEALYYLENVLLRTVFEEK